jgi:3-oxoacyl-[acyl-carrier protein] reductase
MEDTMKLDGKVALVTGASRGIGKAIALGMAKEGAGVMVSCQKAKEAAQQVVDEIRSRGGKAVAIQADVGNTGDRKLLIQETIARLGRIDILVNSAGVIDWHDVFDSTEEEWDRQFDVNAKGLYFLSLEAAREMRKTGGGSIINIISMGGNRARSTISIYAVSKGAACMATQELALELAPYKIRVNGILPCTTETDLNRVHLSVPGAKEAEIAAIPLGRLGRTDDHVGAAVLFASDEGSWITGALLPIDGGISIV